MKYLYIFRDALGALLVSALAGFIFNALAKFQGEQSALFIYHLLLWTLINVIALMLSFLVINLFQPSTHRIPHTSLVALVVGLAMAIHALTLSDASLWRSLFIAAITFLFTVLSAAAGCGLSFALSKQEKQTENQTAQGTN